MKTMDAFWWQLNKKKLAKKTLFNQRQHSDIWTGAKSHRRYGKLTVTWPDGSKSVDSAHKVSFMTSNHFLKKYMPQIDAEGRQLEVSDLCHNGLCIKRAHLTVESNENNQERIHCKLQKQCTRQHQPYCLL